MTQELEVEERRHRTLLSVVYFALRQRYTDRHALSVLGDADGGDFEGDDTRVGKLEDLKPQAFEELLCDLVGNSQERLTAACEARDEERRRVRFG